MAEEIRATQASKLSASAPLAADAKLLAPHVVAGLSFPGGHQHLANAVSKLSAAADSAQAVHTSGDASAIATPSVALGRALVDGQAVTALQSKLRDLSQAVHQHGHALAARSAGAGGAGGGGAAGGAASGAAGAASGAAAKGQGFVDKANAALNKAETDIGRILSDIAKAGHDGKGVVTAGSVPGAVQAGSSLLGDIADGLDALGDLIGGPLGAALQAIAGAINDLATLINSIVGNDSGDQGGQSNTGPGDPGGDTSGGDDPGGDDTGGDTGDGGDSGGDGGFGGGDGGFGGGGGCFTASTGVLMAGGELKAIGELRVGDLVAARDERTCATGAKPVSQVFRHEVDELRILRLANGELIETTDVHRFADPDGKFTAAAKLGVGDRLGTFAPGGESLAGTSTEVGPVSVYNIEVGDFHTFFVGEAGVWVHNAKDQKEDPDGAGGGSDDPD